MKELLICKYYLSVFFLMNNKLSQLIVAIREVKLSFLTFKNKYENAKFDQNFKLDNMKILINNIELIGIDYILYS